MHYVISVEYLSGYKLKLGFEDGSMRIADLASHLDGEVFAPLKILRLFRTARLNPDLDTVVWSNGADMSPDFLYEIGIPIKAASQPVGQVAESKAKYAARRNTDNR
ncbi:MAG: DUF2442 domain-containing protein [Verrucomicrobia bacterium]|nr:DUF2442 domain-containing protein [Verrucomicrobiota bacterium]